jgi:benzaldehyde dehydrogenase (NAD)
MTVQSGSLAIGPILDSAPWSARVFNGEWVSSRGGSVDVNEPATGQALTRVGVANADDIAGATQQAASAQPDWARVATRERAAVFLRAAAYLQQHSEELARFVARGTGGTRAQGQREVAEAGAQLKAAAGMVLPPEGVVLPSTPGRVKVARRVPLGVIGVISAADFPLISSLQSLAPALAAGNAVVLVPDAPMAVVGGYIVALAFQAAGLPVGLLHVLPEAAEAAEAAEALCTDTNVQMIAFTGSTAAGRRVSALASGQLKKVSLRLTSKSALIVLEDADLELAVRNIAWGTYLHRGEVCMATGRVLVREKVTAALTERVVAAARQWVAGAPAAGNVALGPLLTERQRDRVHSIVVEAIAAGAKLEAGASFDGLSYAPTVLSAVTPNMRAFREATFGPVVTITTFASDDEAVTLANEAEHGLSTAVISSSIDRAMAIADRLHSKLVHVNDPALPDEGPSLSGEAASGHRLHGSAPADVDDYSQWRCVTLADSARPYPF